MNVQHALPCSEGSRSIRSITLLKSSHLESIRPQQIFGDQIVWPLINELGGDIAHFFKVQKTSIQFNFLKLGFFFY